jgi:hypothetical protein
MTDTNITPTPVQIPLTQGQIALVDECDADLLQFNWNANFYPNYSDGGAYLAKRHVRIAKGKYAQVSMHRVILERILNRPLLSTEDVDHKNLNPLDNQRHNLRLAISTQNQANRSKQKNSTSGFKGVWWHTKNKKWIANIRINKKTRYLGSFETPEEAHERYKIEAVKLFGEFARFD